MKGSERFPSTGDSFNCWATALIPQNQSNRTISVGYSTVTDLAKLRGWSTSVPFSTAT